jgi:hypothetical protein
MRPAVWLLPLLLAGPVLAQDDAPASAPVEAHPPSAWRPLGLLLACAVCTAGAVGYARRRTSAPETDELSEGLAVSRRMLEAGERLPPETGDPLRDAAALAPALVRELARGHPKRAGPVERSLLAALRVGLDPAPVAADILRVLAGVDPKPGHYGHPIVARVLRVCVRSRRLDGAALRGIEESLAARQPHVAATARAWAGPAAPALARVEGRLEEALLARLEEGLSSPDPGEREAAGRALDDAARTEPPAQAPGLVELLLLDLRTRPAWRRDALEQLGELAGQGADLSLALPALAELFEDEAHAWAATRLALRAATRTDLAPIRGALEVVAARRAGDASRALSTWLRRIGEEPELPEGCSHRPVFATGSAAVSIERWEWERPRCRACGRRDVTPIHFERRGSRHVSASLEVRCPCGKYSEFSARRWDPAAPHSYEEDGDGGCD